MCKVDELNVGRLDGVAGRIERARMVSELVQAQQKLHHDVLRRAATAEDKMVVIGGGARPALAF